MDMRLLIVLFPVLAAASWAGGTRLARIELDETEARLCVHRLARDTTTWLLATLHTCRAMW